MPDRPPWYIPGMNDDRKKPLWPWIVALLIGLPVLYVLSSGPTVTMAWRDEVTFPPGLPIALSDRCQDEWWTNCMPRWSGHLTKPGENS